MHAQCILRSALTYVWSDLSAVTCVGSDLSPSKLFGCTTWLPKLLSKDLVNEPRREKTGLRGFRPGPTQTGLYKLRKELEA